MPAPTHRDPPEPRRQVVSFTFFKVQPEWRRLPAADKAEHRREFASVFGKWRQSEQMTALTYSLSGLRADVDMMLWRICYSLECLQQMQAELMRTRLGAYLETPYSYLAMTRRSQYKIGHGLDNQNTIKCGGYRYRCCPSSRPAPGTNWRLRSASGLSTSTLTPSPTFPACA